jgi:DNA-binding response OmpR family regulator
MPRVALVEDDRNIASGLVQYLESESFQVEHFETIVSFLKVESATFDILLLDWNLPDGCGLDILKKLERLSKRPPTIMLTARTDIIDRVLALELGASDFMSKPFDPRELLARMRVRLREKVVANSGLANSHEPHERMIFGNLELDLRSRKLLVGGVEMDLPKTEFNLVEFFMKNPAKVFTRDELLDAVWGLENYPTTRTVDNHVLLLRQKLGAEWIETVRGVGYRFNVINITKG